MYVTSEQLTLSAATKEQMLGKKIIIQFLYFVFEFI